MKATVLIVGMIATLAYGSIIPFIPGATYLQAAPQYNTAIVQSEQDGGNFAYSVNEAQTFQAITPIIQQV